MRGKGRGDLLGRRNKARLRIVLGMIVHILVGAIILRLHALLPLLW